MFVSPVVEISASSTGISSTGGGPSSCAPQSALRFAGSGGGDAACASSGTTYTSDGSSSSLITSMESLSVYGGFSCATGGGVSSPSRTVCGTCGATDCAVAACCAAMARAIFSTIAL